MLRAGAMPALKKRIGEYELSEKPSAHQILELSEKIIGDVSQKVSGIQDGEIETIYQSILTNTQKLPKGFFIVRRELQSGIQIILSIDPEIRSLV